MGATRPRKSEVNLSKKTGMMWRLCIYKQAVKPPIWCAHNKTKVVFTSSCCRQWSLPYLYRGNFKKFNTVDQKFPDIATYPRSYTPKYPLIDLKHAHTCVDYLPHSNCWGVLSPMAISKQSKMGLIGKQYFWQHPITKLELNGCDFSWQLTKILLCIFMSQSIDSFPVMTL